MMRGVRRGCVRLKGAVIGIDDDDDSTFTITARDKDEREKWIRCLEDTNLRHAFGYKSASTLRLDAVKPAPTIQDFDKKLTEADAYLQILIEQTKALEKRMGPMEDEDKSRCEAILSHANIMLEQVKHTIVLLQIAKISIGKTELNWSVLVMEPHHSGLLPNLTVPDTSYSSSEEEDFYDCNDASELNTPTNTVPPRRDLSQRIFTLTDHVCTRCGCHTVDRVHANRSVLCEWGGCLHYKPRHRHTGLIYRLPPRESLI
ncbi:hypothetical protein LSTR_LSTR012746 [Laodelphax striatellus]|uniref:PH domain-containing protein n=1 Tax=Laodelphax striatellus TaxID=195883 RepID=A0A482WUF2_LAOST|nr:hypothetical protein LSTR_LSTR012746 [Laodelphax striatellus]